MEDYTGSRPQNRLEEMMRTAHDNGPDNSANSTINNGAKTSSDDPLHSSLIQGEVPPLIVFSHLRWHFVSQRPQHLLSRAAASRPIYFFEEPCFDLEEQQEVVHGGKLEFLSAQESPNITVIRPQLRRGTDTVADQRRLLDRFLSERRIKRFDCWYYTPMALSFTEHLRPEVIVYDCMDELSAFDGAPVELTERENQLFRLADVVFTGGRSLYEAKRDRHSNVKVFPSSIDVTHFAQARNAQIDPPDQASIPPPRVGFFGVLDERLDIELVAEVARLRPNIHFVLIGPVAKIDPASLPQASNVHYLGMKSYRELPAYVAGWSAAMMPFALNKSTQYISPTKTPEFLAAGKHVVSTAIADVVADYGAFGLVDIASTADEFALAIDRALASTDDSIWSQRVDRKLALSSWDSTWAAMHAEIEVARSGGMAEDLTGAMDDFTILSLRNHLERYDYLVVGAGFAGGVLAERLATQLGKRVLIIDKRSHVGGNTYDFYNEDGILVHRYGPHIFHTSSQMVVDYLSQFTEWRPYEHRVLASVDGKLLPIPINLDTVNRMYGLNLDSQGMEKFLAERAEARAEIRTSEDVVISRLGRELYEKFFQNYTRKQWGLDPSQLDRTVAGRIPVRFDRDDRYFSDTFQAMPLKGFTHLFEKMLSHPNISIKLSTDYHEETRRYPSAKVIYTGPIDEFFDYCFGPLPYRSLRFEHKTLDRPWFQKVGVVNYPNEHAYTRITEFKHLTGQEHDKTSILYEYPCNDGEPYYPIPRPENAQLYARYRALAEATPDVHFCGRLANYRYFNMDQVVAQALHLFREIAEQDGANIGRGRAVEVPGATLSAFSASPDRFKLLES